MKGEAAIRESFLDQAGWCEKLGSPFTALLCRTLAERLDAGTPGGAAILGWSGDPRASADALALRVAGALHALARSGREPALREIYPPNPPPDAEALWRCCRHALQSHAQHFHDYLALAPQTNEVGRSGVLIAGLLLFAQRFAVPLHLFEIGASAGLNLHADRYRYRFGAATWGDAHAALEIAPAWSGNAPPVDVRLRVASRQGSDIAPIDVGSAEQRARLLSYVWPDQFNRLRRIEQAIDIALTQPTSLEAMDAAEWVELRLPTNDAGEGGRVLLHSVFWNYLPPATQQRIEARVAACGAAATAARPFGWLRFELDPVNGPAALTLTAWPGGEPRLVARAHPHGSTVTYLL